MRQLQTADKMITWHLSVLGLINLVKSQGGHRSLFCGDAELAMDGDAGTAPHDDAVHEGYVGLGQQAQRMVQAVLLPEEAACHIMISTLLRQDLL